MSGEQKVAMLCASAACETGSVGRVKEASLPPAALIPSSLWCVVPVLQFAKKTLERGCPSPTHSLRSKTLWGDVVG